MDIETKELIEELCVDLKAELDDRYVARDIYPSQMAKYASEMDVIKRAKQLIKNSFKSKRYFVFYVTIQRPNLGCAVTFIETDNNKFPTYKEVMKNIENSYLDAKGIYPLGTISGFNEFESEQDYLQFKGQ
jgi:hypothetical protein